MAAGRQGAKALHKWRRRRVNGWIGNSYFFTGGAMLLLSVLGLWFVAVLQNHAQDAGSVRKDREPFAYRGRLSGWKGS